MVGYQELPWAQGITIEQYKRTVVYSSHICTEVTGSSGELLYIQVQTKQDYKVVVHYADRSIL